MAEVDLLRSLPKSTRNVSARSTAKTAEHIRLSREYGELYFDGPREYGYGGYRYDGRWQPVARDIVSHFALKPGDRVLDVGCAKGFLVKDLLALGIDAYGLDISEYALMRCEPEVVGRLHLGSADRLPFPDRSFAAVVSINTIHNLPRHRCVVGLQEMERLAPGRGFVQVDSYRTAAQKEAFEHWVLTAMFHDYPEGWRQVFDEAGYTGDWYWTIV
jgi:ubiquinone/menaquinone biosynthesis C-methylase UbiE